MSTHSNEGDTSHIIPDWEQACKKAERQLKHAYETNLILTKQLHEQRELTVKAEAKVRMK